MGFRLHSLKNKQNRQKEVLRDSTFKRKTMMRARKWRTAKKMWDIEFVMDVPNRSLDFRQGSGRPAANRSTSATIPPTQPKAPQPQPSLTTEYTPIQRGGVTPNASFTTPSASAPQLNAAPLSSGSLTAPSAILASTAQPSSEPAAIQDDGVDPSTLPPVTAPPSHPAIDPTATGVFDGRSILEVDLNAMADKPWRRPGSDISDWFNYGFDEISWEAYCYRRRDLGELANVLKTNVINFAGMPEDQLTALPPEVRTMVMTGATTMMNGAGPGMMGPGVMMDMSGMMGPMSMGMNGDMSMGGAMMQGMMQDGGQGQQQGVGIIQGSGTPEQGAGAVSMMQDGFNAGAAVGGMMNMGIGGEYGMQEQNTMVQELYPNMQGSQTVTPAPGAGRGAAQIPFRGRGAPGLRGRGFPGRGRGRGGLYADAPPPVPVRPASPLPPGVPTGPRNQNKYKDRDGNAPAVDGLDYGGGKESRRTPSGEPEERSSSRKRRSSPGLDDRGSKRR
ncbi:uncharacterized protein LACBIDRAFT_301408 [Laccaria bicolor S238N-H82]|uniref:Predicted protein n=1 Tax=Laccaria bicolor (strain S238N-H82 / ATCC MYA-4686) TaxID=486041 RepID=B0CNH1_LACBS|nr:uncharacterized protein LACBIDRAFT_301408 [Laccaria bicolor S238N-H82]EDR15306.1 predicted protein [Laccaria bicolor S238N-H82]|eukprot:XP_001873514.1 predicted protein [Laccaria bicolor S238N-H82]